MAEITATNKKGALKGLLFLGFNVRNSKPIAITLAFKCVYNFLDNHLSPQDKALLGFDVIFVEHLLCKVKRWHNMLTKACFMKEVDRLLEEAKKEASDGFPLPLQVDRKELLEQIQVMKTRARTEPYLQQN
ncbi:hypothetical protein AAF712_016487 [Marasmius tenuissimus]|uniref:Uncharacterized protein n=1 Tax=Marasmius tenuissimus TaxID=585030 RepID=A0ABR2Z7X6_9AGAR